MLNEYQTSSDYEQFDKELEQHKDIKRLRANIQKVLDEWIYSSYRLGVDLKTITERDSAVRNALDKCIWDLEEAMNK
jgi:hypothetical protein